MDTELSLKLINECLIMELEEKDLDCIETILHPNTESFLKNEKENQDSVLQKLEKEKKSIEEFLESITSEDTAKTKLTEAIARVAAKEQEYNTAESNVQQAEHACNAQVTHINGIEGQLAATNKELDQYARCLCPRRDQLTQQQQTQKQQLNQAKNDLNSKNLDKSSKEQVKINLNTELSNSIVLKNQAEKELSIIQENHQKIQTYDTQLGSAKQEFDNAENMLNQLFNQRDEIEKYSDETTNIEPSYPDTMIIDNAMQESHNEFCN